jgi:hypothetical protein
MGNAFEFRLLHDLYGNQILCTPTINYQIAALALNLTLGFQNSLSLLKLLCDLPFSFKWHSTEHEIITLLLLKYHHILANN